MEHEIYILLHCLYRNPLQEASKTFVDKLMWSDLCVLEPRDKDVYSPMYGLLRVIVKFE